MKLKKLVKALDEIAPRSLALDWDNVGLLVGDRESEVRKIYIALDCDEYAIDEAIKNECNLILTHHPLIFSPLKRVRNDDFCGSRVISLIKNNISMVAMHTNFDVAHMGRLAADRLELENRQILEVTAEIDGAPAGIGVTGEIFAESLKDVVEKVKQAFDLDNVKVFGDLKSEISRISISPGSGKSMIDLASAQGADLLITGDIDHHSGIDAVAMGVSIIDAGHYGLEHIFIEYMKDRIDELDLGIEVITQEFKNPFMIL